MTTKINLTYFGMEGTGRTVTEAKKDAGAKIEEALKGSYTPEILSHGKHAILIYRTPTGWEYRIIADDEGIRSGPVYGTNGKDLASTKKECLEHLAQLAWKPEDGMDVPPILKDRNSIADYRSWVAFQLRYREARAMGMNDNDAHSYAGKNPCRPELWDNVPSAVAG